MVILSHAKKSWEVDDSRNTIGGSTDRFNNTNLEVIVGIEENWERKRNHLK